MASVQADSGSRALQRTGTASDATRRLFRTEDVSPLKSKGKGQNFNPTMCCPGQHHTVLSWQCKSLSSHQSRSGSRFFSCNRLWMPSSLLINGFSGSTAADG
jgi:hypothetical protein